MAPKAEDAADQLGDTDTDNDNDNQDRGRAKAAAGAPPAGEGGDGEPSEAEARARRLGWRPESEWDERRGKKPAKFLSADEYIEKVDNDLPVLRERNRFLDDTVVKLERNLGDANRQINEVSEIVKDLHKQNREVGKRAYERARQDLVEARAEAVKAADPTTFDRVQAQIDELDKTKPSEPLTEDRSRDARVDPPKIDPVVVDWVKENRWFETDPELNAFATALHGRLLREKAGLPLRDNLEEVRTEVERRFPEKFENPRRTGPSVVNPPSGSTTKKKPGKTFEDLPADDKAAFQRLQKHFKTKGHDYTKEQYLEDYQW